MKRNVVEVLIRKMSGFSWQDDKNDNKLALNLLKRFLWEFKSVKPDKYANKSSCIYMFYLVRLFLIRNALIKQEYGVACHELCSLSHYYSLYQIGIQANVVKLLEEYCV